MTHIITVAIRKGGSGKTTTAVNLASALQLRGHSTLLVDLDQSANATMHVGVNPYQLQRAMHTLFTEPGAEPQSVMQMTSFGLALLPATNQLEEVEAGMQAPQIGVLKLILEPLLPYFAYIVIDTPPSHSYLSLSALVASDSALIPLEPHYLAMDGLAKIIDDIKQVKRGLNPQLSLLGIVPVKVQRNTNIAQTILQEIQRVHKNLLLPVEIRYSVKHAEASLVGQPILLYDPHHPSTAEYYHLAEVVYAKTTQAQ